MKIYKNIEGEKDFDIDPEWWNNRRKGLSCYYRVKNEAEFIKPSILSIIDHVDEVIIALQPSVDGTREQIESIDNPKIKLLDYPFELMPNGDGFIKQNAASVHSKTYFYNWTLSKTTCDWAIKWDGDMVALKRIAPFLKQRQFEYVFFGNEIVRMEKDGKWYLSDNHSMSNAAPSGMFKVKKDLSYLNAKRTHRFFNPTAKSRKKAPNTFLHFKWCKEYFNDIWTDNWTDVPSFRACATRAKPGKIYKGEHPEVLLPFVTSDMGQWDRLKRELK